MDQPQQLEHPKYTESPILGIMEVVELNNRFQAIHDHFYGTKRADWYGLAAREALRKSDIKKQGPG